MRLLRVVDEETGRKLYLLWSCPRYPVCSCVHSAHPDGRPMGTPANAATRRARHQAHRVFDQLWQATDFGRLMTRDDAYRWLAGRFGVGDVHIGDMTQAEAEQTEAWANERIGELVGKREQARKQRKAKQRRKRRPPDC